MSNLNLGKKLKTDLALAKPGLLLCHASCREYHSSFVHVPFKSSFANNDIM